MCLAHIWKHKHKFKKILKIARIEFYHDIFRLCFFRMLFLDMHMSQDFFSIRLKENQIFLEHGQGKFFIA